MGGYMTIAEISEKFGMSIDTLRYYERVGLIPPVKRSKGGTRIYTEIDCRWIAYIKCMRNAGISVETLVEYVTLFQQGDKTKDARIDILKEQRALISKHIDDLQKTLKRLDFKIQIYESGGWSFEKSLTGNENAEWEDVYKSITRNGEVIDCGLDEEKAVSLSPMLKPTKKQKRNGNE
jgi:DNA-binding transcriptional MerR regulator